MGTSGEGRSPAARESTYCGVAASWEEMGLRHAGLSLTPASGLAVDVLKVAAAQVVTQTLHGCRSKIEVICNVSHIVLSGQVVDELL